MSPRRKKIIRVLKWYFYKCIPVKCFSFFFLTKLKYWEIKKIAQLFSCSAAECIKGPEKTSHLTYIQWQEFSCGNGIFQLWLYTCEVILSSWFDIICCFSLICNHRACSMFTVSSPVPGVKCTRKKINELVIDFLFQSKPMVWCMLFCLNLLIISVFSSFMTSTTYWPQNLGCD